MVAKILGLATGAVVASIGVWAFNEWRTVSDGDRLASVIAEHCIPYVERGVTPFGGMGRPVGVYDDADLRGGLTEGGTAILFDNRFIAEWGNAVDAQVSARVCSVKDSYSRSDSIGFVIETDNLTGWFDDLVGAEKGLVATPVSTEASPNMLIWQEPDADVSTGLRIVLLTLGGGVSAVSVVHDLAH